jgi:hypothetical protein
MSTHAVRSALVAAAAARLSYAVLTARPPGGATTWDRTNHRGEPVTLLGGPAVAIGGIAGAVAAGGCTRDQIALAVAGAGAAAFGGYDDHAGNGVRKGFRGHLGALRAGELTTGAVKIAGIGATGLAAALIAGPPPGARRDDGGASLSLAVADTLIDAGLVAGGANLLNLFDLRPGRAIKVALLAGGLLAQTRRGRAAAVAPLAAAAALLPEDLGERSMLGDAGANALGAMLGTAAASTLSRPARVGVLAVVVGLTAASERVSFTKVIERTGPLRRLDMLGRRPAPGPATPAPTTPVPATPVPTTVGPTTVGPTTVGPTTGGPTTVGPTTVGPTTGAATPPADPATAGPVPPTRHPADGTLAPRGGRSAEPR